MDDSNLPAKWWTTPEAHVYLSRLVAWAHAWGYAPRDIEALLEKPWKWTPELMEIEHERLSERTH